MSLPDLVISRPDLENLLEYSTTLPTGTIIGKRWRKDVNAIKAMFGGKLGLEPEWAIGEYVHSDEIDWIALGEESLPNQIGIKWYWAVSEPGKVHRGKMGPGKL